MEDWTSRDGINGLIIGANGGIGLGFVKKLLNSPEINQIFATYRQPESANDLLALEKQYPDVLYCLPVDITKEEHIAQAVTKIREQVKSLHLVIYCVGLLHDAQLKPEKSLKHIQTEPLLRYFSVNSVGAVLLAKHLLPLFRHQEKSLFAAISAKVGSIEDNRLGGWYGYRASKAALNMFIRNIAIEYRRSSPQTIVVSLHPGTTDTPLSQPFQKNVPAGKLFSVDRTVTQLLTVIDNLTAEDSGSFFSWDGTPLPW